MYDTSRKWRKASKQIKFEKKTDLFNVHSVPMQKKERLDGLQKTRSRQYTPTTVMTKQRQDNVKRKTWSWHHD
jgi:hypothetical protein